MSKIEPGDIVYRIGLSRGWGTAKLCVGEEYKVYSIGRNVLKVCSKFPDGSHSDDALMFEFDVNAFMKKEHGNVPVFSWFTNSAGSRIFIFWQNIEEFKKSSYFRTEHITFCVPFNTDFSELSGPDLRANVSLLDYYDYPVSMINFNNHGTLISQIFFGEVLIYDREAGGILVNTAAG